MEWLENDRFEQIFDIEYRPEKKWLDLRISVDIRLEQLLKEIPTAPDNKHYDGDPGPIKRWYGNIDGFLFKVEHCDHPTENLTIIVCVSEIKSDEKYWWSVISKIESAPSMFIKNITWIKSKAKNPQYAIYTKDSNDLVNQIYTSEDKVEINELKQYLETSNPTRLYYIDAPEDPNERWVLVNNIDNKIIGDLGHGRLSNQQFAKFWPQFKDLDCVVKLQSTNSYYPEWILWRQDDNGNQFVIKKFWNRQDAMYEKCVLEARGHKQTYFVTEKEIKAA